MLTQIEKRIEETDDEYEPVIVGDLQLNFGFGRKLNEKILFGSSLSCMLEFLHSTNAAGLSLTVGGIYKIEESLQCGISIQNIGINFSENENLPLSIRAGVAKEFKKVVLVSDMFYSILDGTVNLSIGGEYNFGIFLPRVGYKYRFTNTNLEP